MKFSLITVCFNNSAFIAETIESVLAQDHAEIEYIIVDGASNDGTVDIVKGYGKRIHTLISEPDKGVYDAMNKGVHAASGDVIGFVNADDMLAGTDVISTLNTAFEEGYEDAIYGDAYMVDANNIQKVKRYWKGGEYSRDKFRTGWMPPHLGTYIKRKCYLDHGAFRTDLSVSADYELMLRFMYKYKISVRYLPKVIVRFRLGGVSNRSLIHIWKANIEVYRSWKLNGLKVSPLIIFQKPLRKLKQLL